MYLQRTKEENKAKNLKSGEQFHFGDEKREVKPFPSITNLEEVTSVKN